MPITACSRRQFLTTTVAAGGALVPYWLTSAAAKGDQTPSQNDRPHIGAIGVGGRGLALLGQAARFGKVVAVCDVDRRHAERAREQSGAAATIYEDYRRLLERKDVDVIINATPDHWHTAINIAACKAGKDVYTEKPLTLTIDEGKLLSKVVEQTQRVVQVGTQQRSERTFQLAIELVRNHRVGNLKQVWIALPYYTTKAGPFAPQPVPSHLNWELYQGQAPQRDYCYQRTHANFRWWYEYAGGIITDWGNHHMDIAHWGADCELAGPISIEARGMFPNGGAPDSFNTPDRFFSRMIYPNGIEMLYFSSLNDRQRYGGVAKTHEEMTAEKTKYLFGDNCPDEIKTLDRNGIMFIGERGRIFVNRGGVYGAAVDQLKDDPLPENAWRVRPSSDHMGDFFECVKTRHEPVSPVRIQHRTITACHLTNISLRLGRKLAWDPETQRIIGDPTADAWQKRQQRSAYQIQA